MTTERDDLRKFRDAFLDYLEGDRNEPPGVDELSPQQRFKAEAFIQSIAAARGVDPYASRPSIEQLLAAPNKASDPTQVLGNELRRHLQERVDSRATVDPDAASAAMGLASALVVQAQGIRIRVVPETDREDLHAALFPRAEDIAAVFRAFPDCHAVLFSTLGRRPQAVILDRGDAQQAIETPSGELRAPRLRRSVADAGTACESWLRRIVPVFQPPAPQSSHFSDQALEMLDPYDLAQEVVNDVATAGSRARIEAKQTAWRGFGAWEIEKLGALVLEASRGPLSEDDYRARIDELAEAAA